MIIAPETILGARDISRAKLLNTVLKVLPRFHPAGRTLPVVVNAFLKARRIFPSHADRAGDVHVSTREFVIDGRTVTMRCLFPEGKPAAVYLHYHGGAWVMLDARTGERFALPLVRDCGWAVFIPEFHPATDDRIDLTFKDAKAALRAALQMCREQAVCSLVVGGESSGAHLALSALLDATKLSADADISGFLALCGAFDTKGSSTLKASGNTLVMNAPSAKKNLDRLFGEIAPAAPLAPLEADLSRLPPCLLIAGALDPIVGDTVELYSRWQDHSGNAQMVIMPEAPHGFYWLPTRLASKSAAYARRWVCQHC